MALAWRHLFRRRGLGYLESEPRPQDIPFSAADIERVTHPSDVMLPRPFRLYQGGTSTCVAQALSGAIAALESLLYGKLDYPPSRLAIYWWSRWLHDATHYDRGTYMSTALTALASRGTPDEPVWPWRPFTRMNKKPDMRARSLGFGRHGGIYRWINSQGDARLRDIQTALASKRPVVVAGQIDLAFQIGYPADRVIPAPDSRRLIGGHAMYLRGYRTREGLQGRLANSWEGWGDESEAWASEAWLTSPQLSRIVVMDKFRGQM